MTWNPVGTHAPAWQAMFEPALPQGVPLLAGVWVSVHRGAPVLQSTTPLSHGLAGEQAVLTAQATHCPALLPAPQTSSAAHDPGCPACTFMFWSTQICCPVVHSNCPTSQGKPGGLHAPPAVHATQDPPLHTSLFPQPEPSMSVPMVSVHTATPVVQSKLPV
jgi:hypothetical protein